MVVVMGYIYILYRLLDYPQFFFGVCYICIYWLVDDASNMNFRAMAIMAQPPAMAREKLHH